MVDGAIHVVAADGDVAIGAAAGLLHDLELLVADKDAGVTGSDLHVQHSADQVSHLHGLFLVAGVDTDMQQLQAQHGVNSFLALCGDLCPVAGLDHIALAHPGAAHGKDLVIAQIIVDVLGVDAAGAHPACALQGSADVLQHAHAAVCLSGEELQSLAAHVHGLLHLACGAGAGHHDAALVDDVLADLGVEAGSNDEGSTGSHSTVGLLAGQNGAGTQQHLGHLLVDLADALFSTGSAEGDLSCGQTALSQSLAQGQGLINAVESDNRDNADLIDLFYDGIHNAFLLLYLNSLGASGLLQWAQYPHTRL